jgi:arsenate reductase (thioredoxin)
MAETACGWTLWVSVISMVHPEVLEVMSELGLDLSQRRPQRLSRERAAQADVVVTRGCGDACPYIPGKRYVDWELPDPKGRPVAEVRATRDDIARCVEALVEQLDYGRLDDDQV